MLRTNTSEQLTFEALKARNISAWAEGPGIGRDESLTSLPKAGGAGVAVTTELFSSMQAPKIATKDQPFLPRSHLFQRAETLSFPGHVCLHPGKQFRRSALHSNLRLPRTAFIVT